MTGGRPLSESQRKQLAAIRNIWKGKSLLSSESAWTSEARQPQLKGLELKQLEFAHELRRKMETAATLAERASSSQDIRPLLLDTIPDMHRLVSLTEAVRGGYVLPRYNEYIGEFKRQEENRLQKVTQAKEILQHQIERMADPNREWPSRTGIETLDEPPQKEEVEANPYWNPLPDHHESAETVPTEQQFLDDDQSPPAWVAAMPLALPDPDEPIENQQIFIPDSDVEDNEEREFKDDIDTRRHLMAMQGRLFSDQEDNENPKKKKKKKSKKRKRRYDSNALSYPEPEATTSAPWSQERNTGRKKHFKKRR